MQQGERRQPCAGAVVPLHGAAAPGAGSIPGAMGTGAPQGAAASSHARVLVHVRVFHG